MTLRIDPEKNEVHALKAMTDWHNKRILEIGCGNGRLTRRLANLGAQVEAIDPNRKLIANAKKDAPVRLADRARGRSAAAEKATPGRYPAAHRLAGCSHCLGSRVSRFGVLGGRGFDLIRDVRGDWLIV